MALFTQKKIVEPTKKNGASPRPSPTGSKCCGVVAIIFGLLLVFLGSVLCVGSQEVSSTSAMFPNLSSDERNVLYAGAKVRHVSRRADHLFHGIGCIVWGVILVICGIVACCKRSPTTEEDEDDSGSEAPGTIIVTRAPGAPAPTGVSTSHPPSSKKTKSKCCGVLCIIFGGVLVLLGRAVLLEAWRAFLSQGMLYMVWGVVVLGVVLFICGIVECNKVETPTEEEDNAPHNAQIIVTRPGGTYAPVCSAHPPMHLIQPVMYQQQPVLASHQQQRQSQPVMMIQQQQRQSQPVMMIQQQQPTMVVQQQQPQLLAAGHQRRSQVVRDAAIQARASAAPAPESMYPGFLVQGVAVTKPAL